MQLSNYSGRSLPNLVNTRNKITSEWTLYFNGIEYMKYNNYFKVMNEFFKLKHEYPNENISVEKREIHREIWCNNGRDLEE